MALKQPLTAPKVFAEAMRGRSVGATPTKPLVASMGLYVFNVAVLRGILARPELADFGKDVIPFALEHGLKVQVSHRSGETERVDLWAHT